MAEYASDGTDDEAPDATKEKETTQLLSPEQQDLLEPERFSGLAVGDVWRFVWFGR